MSNLPPAKKVPKTQADPLVAAAQELGAEVRELPPDANKRLNAMWRGHIEPALEDLAEKDAELAGQIAAVYSKLSDLRMLFTVSLYDADALATLDAELADSEKVIRATPARVKAALDGKVDRDEKRRDLVSRASDIERMHRVDIRNATYTNEADKVKYTYPNDPARDDELTDRLAKSGAYLPIAAALDKLDLADAAMKCDLEEIERERSAASKLLNSQSRRLENLTARLLTPTPLGGHND